MKYGKSTRIAAVLSFGVLAAIAGTAPSAFAQGPTTQSAAMTKVAPASGAVAFGAPNTLPPCTPTQTVYVTPTQGQVAALASISAADWFIYDSSKPAEQNVGGTATFTTDGLELKVEAGQQIYGNVAYSNTGSCVPQIEATKISGTQAISTNMYGNTPTVGWFGLFQDPTIRGTNEWLSNRELGVTSTCTTNAPLWPNCAEFESFVAQGTGVQFNYGGFSLGSGQAGEWLLKSMTLGDTKYVFRADLTVKAIATVLEYTTTAGVAPTLPGTIQITMSDDSIVTPTVVWDAIDNIDTPGTYEVRGVYTLDGEEHEITATVTVTAAATTPATTPPAATATPVLEASETPSDPATGAGSASATVAAAAALANTGSNTGWMIPGALAIAAAGAGVLALRRRQANNA